MPQRLRSRTAPVPSRPGRWLALVPALLVVLGIAATGSLFSGQTDAPDPDIAVMSPVTSLVMPIVTPATEQLAFGEQAVGEDATSQLYVLNTTKTAVVLRDAVVYDHDATDFSARLVEDTPLILAPNASTRIEVTFHPRASGPRTASLQIVHAARPAGVRDPVISLTGTGLPADARVATAQIDETLDGPDGTARGAARAQGPAGSGGAQPTPAGGSQHAVTNLGSGGGGGGHVSGPPRVTATRERMKLGPGMSPPGGGSGGGNEPTIVTMTGSGGSSSGDSVTVSGTNFTPGAMTVRWGNDTIDPSDLTATIDTIVFDAPDHAPGLVWARVETAQGTSNTKTFLYTPDGGVPVDFDFEADTESTSPQKPTCGDWGPDGRLYVGTLEGKLYAFTFDENYNSIGKSKYNGVSSLSNPAIMGLTFNPWDDASPVKVYVAHTELYAQGGGAFSGPSPFPGEVSILSGPTFDAPDTIITKLPTSNHDHGMNGMVFDHNGDLLMCSGGTTNAGVEDKDIGDLPESPLSGAIIRARTSLGGGFDGDIEYVFRGSPGTSSNDQVDGHDLVVKSGVDLDVFAPGLRNSFDLLLHTNGYLYATDNGPNSGFGDASTGPSSDDGTVSAPDEICLIEFDEYYGHPNRARGPDDSRQYVYRDPDDSSIPGLYTAPLDVVSSSTNGIDEYRGTTFEGAMRGDLLAQRWTGKLAWAELSSDGRSIVDYDETFTNTTYSLNLRYSPGGAIVGMHHQGKVINVLTPVDAGAVGVVAYDVTPWRAPATGGATLVIGGDNFTTAAETTVTIGGNAATVLSVSARRIRVAVPVESAPTPALLDVVVRCGDEASTIPAAFRYLLPMGSEPGAWTSVASAPESVGDVAAGVAGNQLLVVGGNTPHTLAYDLADRSWAAADARAERPFPGRHHAAEVFDGRLFLFGGVGAGSAGQVQVYDPELDAWTLGTRMPWAGGACATARIGDLIYVAGGSLDESSTTNETAAYDPRRDEWTVALAPMPAGRNQAQAATEGARLWVFGGRGPGSGAGPGLANGFADIQVYDPATDSWTSSSDPGSALRPMPAPRAGGGKAIYHRNRFWILGGSTLDDPGATADGVFDRVDVYDPATNSWRTDAPMLTPRHGIDPVLHDGRIFVVGGGASAATAHSTTTEMFSR